MNRQDLHENLPWHVNQQLDPKQQADIERQLRDDPELQQEAEFLRKLRRQIKQGGAASPGELGLQRLKRDLRKEAGAPLLKRWRAVAVAASLLMVVQAGVMVSMIPTDDAGIAPLSGTDYVGTVIQIQFHEQASEQDIRETLLGVNGSIIEGPSASGVYRIQLKDATEDSINPTIDQLKANDDVVDFVAVE